MQPDEADKETTGSDAHDADGEEPTSVRIITEVEGLAAILKARRKPSGTDGEQDPDPDGELPVSEE